MILKRIASAIRKQDWGTAAVEFIIVVAGIFVGLQVDSWNSDRVDRKNERVILEQLHADFRANAEFIGQLAERHERSAEELRFALDILTRGELPNSEAGRFRNAFVSMYQLPPVAAAMGGYNAMIAGGDLGLIRNQSLRVRLAGLQADIAEELSLMQYFRGSFRNNSEFTRDVVLMIPNADRSSLNLSIDFDAVKSDHRMILVVADQRRSHQIFGQARRGLADQFASIADYIETLLGDIEDQEPEEQPRG